MNFLVEILKDENTDMHYFRVFIQEKKIQKLMQNLKF